MSKKKPTNAPTPKQIKEFAGYLKEYQVKMNLNNWRIEHSGKPAAPFSMSEVVLSSEDRLAIWSIGMDWGPLKIDSTILRATALHEVLHVFFCAYREAVFDRDEDRAYAEEHSLVIVLEKLLT